MSTRSSFRGSTRTPSSCSCDHVSIWPNGGLSADCHAARTHASAGRSDQPYARRPRDGRSYASQARRATSSVAAPKCSARPLAPSLAAAAGDTTFSAGTIGRSSSRRGSSGVAGGWTRAHGCGAPHRCRRGCPPGSQAAHPLHFGHCLAARQRIWRAIDRVLPVAMAMLRARAGGTGSELAARGFTTFVLCRTRLRRSVVV